jgi:signal transduction histidine kinase
MPRPAAQLVTPADQSIVTRLFDNRSGRVIAVTRLMLAAAFLLALWIDPNQPARSSAAGYTILAGYLGMAAICCVIAWRSWWWDFRLAWPAHVVDVLAFLSAVFFTEGVDEDFTSPFLAFFAFLMLAATLRWGWRMTVATAVVSTLLYLFVGLAMESAAIELDTLRFGRRVVYMIVLSMILIWLGHQRRFQRVDRFVEPPGAGDERLPPLQDALRYAMTQTDAQRGAIAWADEEEPQIELRVIGLGCQAGRLALDTLPAETPFAARARLFDSRRNRILRSAADGGFATVSGEVDDALAAYCGITEGLALPFEAVTGRGVVLLSDIPGACADHVAVAREVAREIGAGFDRHSTLALVREGAVTRMRDAVARDLHDTIAQSLAGAAMRLEGLRNWIAGGGDPEVEIQSIRTALKGEQIQVRAMIERLRLGESVLPESGVQSTIGPLLRDLASYWGIEATLDAGSGAVIMPGWLAHELRQLVREAVANAVRHGQARHIWVSLGETEDALIVTIADNGAGFEDTAVVRRPRSISERVAQLGGSLDLNTGPDGTTLNLSLPLRAGQ